jgi:hypothetical protein
MTIRNGQFRIESFYDTLAVFKGQLSIVFLVMFLDTLPLSNQCDVKHFDWQYSLQKYFVGCRVLQKC